VGINHGSFQAGMTQQGLNHPNVVTGLQQVGGKRMAEGV